MKWKKKNNEFVSNFFFQKQKEKMLELEMNLICKKNKKDNKKICILINIFNFMFYHLLLLNVILYKKIKKIPNLIIIKF